MIKKIKPISAKRKDVKLKTAAGTKKIEQDDRIDLVIIGAGPAGLSAAAEAAKNKLDVLLIDKNDIAGGQLYKQIHKFFGSTRHGAGQRGFEIADLLYKECTRYKVKIMLEAVCAGVFFDQGIEVSIIKNERLQQIKCKHLIISSGAKEKTMAFPGWDLPNIMGAGAVQTLVNLHRVIPGKRVLMVGSGNVGLIVSYQLIQAGMEVAGIVELGNKCSGYYVHYAKLKRLNVPFYFSHTVKEAEGNDGVEQVTIVRVTERGRYVPETEKKIPADLICLAIGLKPQSELCQVAGCKMYYNVRLNQVIPVYNDEMETTINNIYVAGDASGAEEASIAMEQGKLAAISIAAKSGKVNKRLRNKYKTEINKNIAQLRAYRKMFAKCRKKDIDRWRRKKGAVAVLDCNEDIPCDACRKICHRSAIKMDRDITSIPSIDLNKCRGCGLCIPYCPGLAIFVIDDTFSNDRSLVKLPYELLPVPREGKVVDAVDKNGKILCEAKVIKVDNQRKNNKTKVISIALPKRFSNSARGIKMR
ncbi:MAG: FAD-dependent oxidoreductase [Candidatus Omnitrophota bacterium]